MVYYLVDWKSCWIAFEFVVTMDTKLFTEPPGVVILVFLVLLLVATMILRVCCRCIMNGEKGDQRQRQNYTLLENKYIVCETQSNMIQPPTDSRIKVRLVPTVDTEAYKNHTLKYSEDNSKIEKKIDDETRTFQKPITNYREKFFGLLNKSGTRKLSVGKQNSKPELIEVTEKKTKNLSKFQTRLRRPDSIYEDGLGRITFTLSYSSNDETLTVHLIAGRQIYSNDQLYEVRLPVIGVQLEGLPDTEVTSNPDEAPNPEYDQEFTFPLREFELYSTVLRFTVMDIIATHESRVLGFFRVNLSSFQNSLSENIDSGPICRDIKPTLAEQSEGIGEILVSLFYDCVTDKIKVRLRQLRNLGIYQDDVDLYVKVSFLLDNDVIQSKRTPVYSVGKNLEVNQTFEFNALSNDLDHPSTDPPSIRVAEELLSYTSQSSKNSLLLNDNNNHSTLASSSSSSIASETLRNNMGILISVRATTIDRSKRVVGRLYIGRTNIPTNDEDFHWIEMIKNFDSTITQWHCLKLKKI